MSVRNTAALLGFVWLTLFSLTSNAQRTSGEYLTNDEGIAIGGYDVVAYFTEGEARLGDRAFGATWQNVEWWFSSEEHRDLFVADPQAYAPAYGGWCAFGMAQGYAADTDPEKAWSIVNDRLYLNWDRKISRKWRRNSAEYLKQSEAEWLTVRDQLKTGSAKVYWHQ